MRHVKTLTYCTMVIEKRLSKPFTPNRKTMQNLTTEIENVIAEHAGVAAYMREYIATAKRCHPDNVTEIQRILNIGMNTLLSSWYSDDVIKAKRALTVHRTNDEYLNSFKSHVLPVLSTLES